MLYRLVRRLCERSVAQCLVPSYFSYRFLAWLFVVVRRLRHRARAPLLHALLGELSLLCVRPCVAHCHTCSLPYARRAPGGLFVILDGAPMGSLLAKEHVLLVGV